MTYKGSNEFCVWFNVGKMRTFPTFRQALTFGRGCKARIGQMRDTDGWWHELAVDAAGVPVPGSFICEGCYRQPCECLPNDASANPEGC